jgi:membrane-associated protein
MDLISLFSHFGFWGLGGILMVETGFLPLFFLPGDTLLFTAGYLIKSGGLNIYHAFMILVVGAFIGNIIGYYMGVFAEKSVMNFVKNKASFNKAITKTHKFYEKYGIVTLLFARFVPSVRTIAPFLAGVALMPIAPFVIISFVSALLKMRL